MITMKRIRTKILFNDENIVVHRSIRTVCYASSVSIDFSVNEPIIVP